MKEVVSLVNSLVVTDSDLDRFIGCECEFKELAGLTLEQAKAQGVMGWGRAGRFKVVAVQRLYGGVLGLRVLPVENRLGAAGEIGWPAKVEELTIFE